MVCRAQCRQVHRRIGTPTTTPDTGAGEGSFYLYWLLSASSATQRSSTQVVQLKGSIRVGKKTHRPETRTLSKKSVHEEHVGESTIPAGSGKCMSRNTHYSLARTFPPLCLCKDRTNGRSCSTQSVRIVIFAVLVIKYRLTILIAISKSKNFKLPIVCLSTCLSTCYLFPSLC